MFNNKKVTAIIVAAGLGKRMGDIGKNKVYLTLLGIPILARTIAAFEENSVIDEIIVAVRSDEIAFCQEEIIEKNDYTKVMKVMTGGKERQDSVSLALDATSADSEIVLVHDGARPLIAKDTIENVVKAIADYGAAAVGVLVKDTIKIMEGQFVKETPDRSILRAMQTPQGAERKILQEAMEQAKADGFYGTDEAVLLERIGKKVFIVEGKYDNIKVTTYEDIAIAEAILKSIC